MYHCRPDEVYPYVYLLHYLPTNKWYIGSRGRNVHKNFSPREDFFIRYFTSSKVVKRLIKKSGLSAFTFQIILTCDSYDEALSMEDSLYWEMKAEPLELINLRSPKLGLNNWGWFDSSRKGKKERTSNNPLAQKGRPSVYQLWVEKYGQKEADTRMVIYKQKISNTGKSRSAKAVPKRIQTMKNKSPKEREKYLQNLREGMALVRFERINKLTKTQQAQPQEYWDKIMEKRRATLSKVSPEEREARRATRSEKMKEVRARQDYKTGIVKNPEERVKKFKENRAARTPEQKAEENCKRSESLRQAWAKRKAKQAEVTN